ncbi:MAG: ATP-binding protein [Rhodospirillaceae bacterium]|nr:ATP-binding protein [Rhodospirillaceae bacterium]
MTSSETGTTSCEATSTPRVIAVVFDVHHDLEALMREAAWIVRERGGVMRLVLRRQTGLRGLLFGGADMARIERLAARWHADIATWNKPSELIAALMGPLPIGGIILGPARNRPWDAGLSTSTIDAITTFAATARTPVTQNLGRRRHYTQLWPTLEWRLNAQRPWFHDYVLSAFAVSLAALAAKWLDGPLPAASLSPIFLTAVIYSASVYGLAAALFTSLFSVAVFDFFFLEPRFALALKSVDNILLLMMFLVVAVITSNLASGLRRQAQRAERQALEARAMFQLTRDIAVAAETTDIYRAIVRHSEDLFECDAVLLAPFRAPNTEAAARSQRAALQVICPPAAQLTNDEIEAARDAFARPIASLPADQHDRGGTLYFPLTIPEGSIAVLVLKNIAVDLTETEAFRRLVESLCRIAAIAVERTLRKQELENARVLAQTEGLRSALLSAISHDFGTPLASIIGSASSLQSYGETYSPHVVRELLATILEEAERLNRFVKNVLQMNKLEAGVLVPRYQWADVGDLISTALDASQRRLTDHEIYVDIADRLPLVHVDFVLMESVLVNVLDNAAKYAPIESDIQVTARRMGEDVVIDVTDHGRGIAPEELGAVFDKFYRAKHRDRTVPGTGLGLAICKGIVEAHGGTIEALSSGLDAGTTIRIRLPVRAPDEEEMAEI